MSITALAALHIANLLKRITSYTLDCLIVLYGCGNDSEEVLDRPGITPRGVGERPVVELSVDLELTAPQIYQYEQTQWTGSHCPVRQCSDS